MSRTIRTRRLAIGVAALMLMALVVGCGTTTSNSEQTATSGDTGNSGNGDQQAATKYGPDNPLNVVFLYQSATPQDGGWNQSWDDARKEIQEHFGDSVKTSYKLSVPDTAEAVNIIDTAVQEGADLVIGVSYGHGPNVLKAAKKHPDVYFMQSQWKSPGQQNFAGLDVAPEEGYYLAGMAAAAASETGKLGAIVPFAVPFVLRELNGFALGAQAINPDIEIRGIVTNAWFDPAKDVQAARALISSGADGIARLLDDAAVDRAAQNADVVWVGTGVDTTEGAPKTALTSPMWLWAAPLIKQIQGLLDGTWSTDFQYVGFQEGGVDISPWGEGFDRVSDADQQKIEDTKTALTTGEFDVFTGPINDTSGNVAVPDGQTLDVDDLLGMNFVVEGVDGVSVQG